VPQGNDTGRIAANGAHGRFRTIVHTISTAMLTGVSQAGRAGAGWPRRRRIVQFSHAAMPISTTGMASALSCRAAVRSPCSRSCTIRSPPQAGQYRPVAA
jgi:hypothetical protein